jgi:hypothetical protein
LLTIGGPQLTLLVLGVFLPENLFFNRAKESDFSDGYPGDADNLVFSKKKGGKNTPTTPAEALNQNEASAVPPGGGQNSNQDDDEDKQKKGKPKRNTDQNKRVDDAGRQFRLTPEQRRILGRIVERDSREGGLNLTYDDILEIAEEVANGRSSY